MLRLDPIIAVKDVEASAKWYETIFDCKNSHGGSEFAVLKTSDDEVVLCIHRWGEHEHPSMIDSEVPPGNGLILYFRTLNLEDIREKVRMLGYPVHTEIQPNPNSHQKEFTLRDPDGYFVTVTEYHNY